MPFKFKSVYFITFDACVPPTNEKDLKFEHDEPVNGLLRWITSEEEPGDEAFNDRFYLKLEHKRDSLPDEERYPLIRLNFPLNTEYNNTRAIQIMEARFRHMLLPAKIYISLHCTLLDDDGKQRYINSRNEYDYLRIPTEKLSWMLWKTIPPSLHHDIVFHLFSCSSIFFSKAFQNAMYKNGFRNCFTVGYNDLAIAFSPGKSSGDTFRLKDFSAKSQTYNEDGTLVFKHRSNDPEYKDRKVLNYTYGGTAVQIPYRTAMESHQPFKLAHKDLFSYERMRINITFILDLIISSYGATGAPRRGKLNAFDAFIRDLCEQVKPKIYKEDLPRQVNFCRAVVAAIRYSLTPYEERKTFYAALKMSNFEGLLDKLEPLLIEAVEDDDSHLQHPPASPRSSRTFRVITGDVDGFIEKTLHLNEFPNFSGVDLRAK